MNTTIKLNDLASTIEGLAKAKSKEVEAKILVELNSAKDDCLSTIKNTAPRSNMVERVHLADSFVAKRIGDNLGTRYIIYSKDKGPLVHLVEFGFTHYKSKKFVRGKQFMLPALDKASKQLVLNIKRKIKN